MQSHKQDSFDGGRAPDLSAGPAAPSNQMDAAAADAGDLALLTAILSLTGESELPWAAPIIGAPSEAAPVGALRTRKPGAAV